MPRERARTSRRQVIRAAGMSIALPALASLSDLPFLKTVAGADPGDGPRDDLPPRRFACIFFPNGVSLPPEDHPAHAAWHWFPHQTGSDYELTRPLEPLAGLRDQLSILSGLSHPAMRSTIAHITADTFLTAADSSRHYTNSISLDQFLAGEIGHRTRFSSLTLSSDGGVGPPGRTRTLSFSASGQPIPSLSEPRAIFNRLFGIPPRALVEQRRDIGGRKSILDHVRSEAETIRRQVSAEDRRKLDHYTTSIREIERRLSGADRWLDAQRPTVDADQLDLSLTPEGDAESYLRVILDLIYLAFLTDSTRAITYQITSEDAKGIGDRFPQSLGLPGHHALSHGTAKPEGYEQWSRYDRFLTEQFAYLVERLRDTEDPFQEGSLLDNSVLLYGGSTSRTHQAVNYPMILAGGRRMGLSHGSHHRFDESRVRLSDLFVTLLQQLGLEVDRFADSRSTLDLLLA